MVGMFSRKFQKVSHFGQVKNFNSVFKFYNIFKILGSDQSSSSLGHLLFSFNFYSKESGILLSYRMLTIWLFCSCIYKLPVGIIIFAITFQIRAKVMGALVTLGWFFSFVQLLAFETVTSTFGPHVSFLCFAVINVFGVCLVLVFLPETKGKSVEQIEIELEKKWMKK